MHKKRLLTNAGAAIAQALVSGVLLFVLYRYLLETIGIEKIGIWSLVLATTAASRMTELGIGGSVVPFVARYKAIGEEEQAARVTQTAAVSIAVLLGSIILLAYPLLKWLLALILSGPEVADAMALLPFALISLLISGVAGVFQAGLEGCQRLDLRSLLVMGSAGLYFALTVIMVPYFGLVGIALAQLVQAVVLLFAAWILLRHHLPTLPAFPYQWNRQLFREMLGYGVKFQIISISLMLIEPVTKGLMAKFGDLSMVGYYEMSNRMIVQFRSLLLSANQALVPVIAGMQQQSPQSVRRLYLDSHHIMFFLATPMFALIVAIAPLVSVLWIGHYESVFVIFTLILACGWYVNTLSVPAYFFGLGTAKLGWNTISHVIMAVANAGFAWGLGHYWDGMGVAFGRALALIMSSLILIQACKSDNEIGVGQFLPKADLLLVILCASVAIAALPLYIELAKVFSVMQAAAFSAFLVMIVMGVAAWRHPMRVRIFSWLRVRVT